MPIHRGAGSPGYAPGLGGWFRVCVGGSLVEVQFTLPCVRNSQDINPNAVHGTIGVCAFGGSGVDLMARPSQFADSLAGVRGVAIAAKLGNRCRAAGQALQDRQALALYSVVGGMPVHAITAASVNAGPLGGR